MSDTRAAMREFRFLDDKWKQGGLSPAEEQRWGELRQALGLPEEPAVAQAQYPDPNAAQAQAQGYYAEDGNWYPYPEGYDPNAQAQGYYAEDGNWYPYTVEQLAQWAESQGYDPAQAAAWAQQQVYGQNAYAEQGGYAGEAQQPYVDPHATPVGYDPNATAQEALETQPPVDPLTQGNGFASEESATQGFSEEAFEGGQGSEAGEIPEPSVGLTTEPDLSPQPTVEAAPEPVLEVAPEPAFEASLEAAFEATPEP